MYTKTPYVTKKNIKKTIIKCNHSFKIRVRNESNRDVNWRIVINEPVGDDV